MIFFFDSTTNINIIKDQNLEESYRMMALDEDREVEALEWAEVTISDVSNETIIKYPFKGYQSSSDIISILQDKDIMED